MQFYSLLYSSVYHGSYLCHIPDFLLGVIFLAIPEKLPLMICILSTFVGMGNRAGGWNVSHKIGCLYVSSPTNPELFWVCHVYASSLKAIRRWWSRSIKGYRKVIYINVDRVNEVV